MALLTLCLAAVLPEIAAAQSSTAAQSTARARQLELEIEALRWQKAGISPMASAVMIATGGASVTLALVGYIGRFFDGWEYFLCQEQSDDPARCSRGLLSSETARVGLPLLGVAGLALGGGGLWLASKNSRRRRAIGKQIKARKEALDKLSFNVALGRELALLQMSLEL